MRGTMRDMDFAERMRAAREGAGLSLNEAAVQIRPWLPKAQWFGLDTIRRMEVGVTPEDKADPVNVAALARVYGTTTPHLSPVAAEGLLKLRQLVLEPDPVDPDAASDVPVRGSGWNLDRAIVPAPIIPLHRVA